MKIIRSILAGLLVWSAVPFMAIAAALVNLALRIEVDERKIRLRGYTVQFTKSSDGDTISRKAKDER